MVGRTWWRVLLVVGVVGLWSADAQAKWVFFDWGGEKIIKIADFPDTPEFQTSDGHQFDAGAIYKRFRVFYVPLWVYDVRWCGYISETLFMETNTVDIGVFARAAGVTLPTAPPIPFWDEWGGKLVALLLLVGGGILGWLWYQEKQGKAVEPAEE